MSAYYVMVEDKSKPGQAPTMKFAKNESEADSIIQSAKSMGLTAVKKPATSFENGAARARQAIANKMENAGIGKYQRGLSTAVGRGGGRAGGAFTPIYTGAKGTVSKFQGAYYLDLSGISYEFPTLDMAKTAADTGNTQYGTKIQNTNTTSILNDFKRGVLTYQQALVKLMEADPSLTKERAEAMLDEVA